MATRKQKNSLSRRIWELPFARVLHPDDEFKIPLGLYSQFGAMMEVIKVSGRKAKFPETITWGCLPTDVITEEYIASFQEHFFGPFFYLNYQWYLQTPHWRRVRKAIHTLRGSKCEKCQGQGEELNVHHKTYKNVGREMEADLEILCRSCHLKHHAEKREKKKAQLANRNTNTEITEEEASMLHEARLAVLKKRGQKEREARMS